MAYVRTVKTSSGATAVQIVHSYHRGSRECPQLFGPDRVAVPASLPQRDPQRDHDQVDVLAGLGVPGDDPLGEHVHDERPYVQPVQVRT